MKLLHNYWGVLLSLFITGFPFTFLLTLSYISRHRSGAGEGGGDARRRAARAVLAILLPLLLPGLAITFCLSFVQAFSVFPSAVLLGAPAGPTRVISIAAYQAAFEHYDYSMASAIAMIMGLAQLASSSCCCRPRGFVYRGPVGGRQGMRRCSATALSLASVGVGVWRAGRLVRRSTCIALIAAVVINSFATRWLGPGCRPASRRDGILPPGTSSSSAMCSRSLSRSCSRSWLLSGLIGVPAAYAMARREFPGKRLVCCCSSLPLLVPPITYGIPLATVLYQTHWPARCPASCSPISCRPFPSSSWS